MTNKAQKKGILLTIKTELKNHDKIPLHIHKMAMVKGKKIKR